MIASHPRANHVCGKLKKKPNMDFTITPGWWRHQSRYNSDLTSSDHYWTIMDVRAGCVGLALISSAVINHLKRRLKFFSWDFQGGQREDHTPKMIRSSEDQGLSWQSLTKLNQDKWQKCSIQHGVTGWFVATAVKQAWWHLQQEMPIKMKTVQIMLTNTSYSCVMRQI